VPRLQDQSLPPVQPEDIIVKWMTRAVCGLWSELEEIPGNGIALG